MLHIQHIPLSHNDHDSEQFRFMQRIGGNTPSGHRVARGIRFCRRRLKHHRPLQSTVSPVPDGSVLCGDVRRIDALRSPVTGVLQEPVFTSDRPLQTSFIPAAFSAVLFPAICRRPVVFIEANNGVDDFLPNTGPSGTELVTGIELLCDEFATKHTERRDRPVELQSQIVAYDRDRNEIIDAAIRSFELSQNLRSKKFAADWATKRLVEIV